LEGEAVTLPSAVFYDFEDHSYGSARRIQTYVEGEKAGCCAR